MSVMADIDNVVALGGSSLDFVMHFGYQRTHRINNVATEFLSGLHNLGCRAVRRKHDRATLWNLT